MLRVKNAQSQDLSMNKPHIFEKKKKHKEKSKRVIGFEPYLHFLEDSNLPTCTTHTHLMLNKKSSYFPKVLLSFLPLTSTTDKND
jgi:hypothetical protein